MSDACILCDGNVPRSTPHFVVDRVAARGEALIRRAAGVMCGDVDACALRLSRRLACRAGARSDHQAALQHALQFV